MRIRASVDIEASPSTVFGWLEDPEKAKAWMTSVGETEVFEWKPGMVGTTFREVVVDGSGRMEMRGFISAFERDRLIAFHLESRANEVDVQYVLEPRDGGAAVLVDSQIRWRFPINLIAIAAGRRMRREIVAQLESELARLKAICEAKGTAE